MRPALAVGLRPIYLTSPTCQSDLLQTLMDLFVNIAFPRNGSVQELSRVINNIKYSLIGAPRLMNRKEGEYKNQPVSVTVFDGWSNTHPQFPHGLQFSQQCVVVTVMLPPHGGAAGIISQHISRTVDRMCPLNDAAFWCRTGCINPLLNFSDRQ